MFQFTQSRPRRGLFGGQSAGLVAGDQVTQRDPLDIWSARPGMEGPTQPNIGEISVAPPMEAKSKHNWGGIAADFLSGLAGQPGQYLASINAEKERAEKAREYQQRRADSNADWRSHYDIEHSGPDYGYEQDNAGNKWRFDKRTGKFDDKPLFIDPNPRQFLQDGQLITVPNVVGQRFGQAAGGGAMSPPPAAVEHLRGNPALKDAFDAKYGPGAADRALGGASGSPAGGGFPY